MDSIPVYNAESVPKTLRAIVCTCEVTETTGWQPLDQVKPLTCKKCRKMPRYLVRQCRGCAAHFAKDFEHPRYSSDYPLCWVCIELPQHDEAVTASKPFLDKRISPPYYKEKLEKANEPINEMELLGFELRMS